MKKLFAILAVAAVMTACNNAAEEKAAVVDTPKTESPLMDAVKTADSVNKMIDSTHNHPMMDSSNKK
jgi:PBP1b-binding outer membrane lipoprotein LpoB